MANPFPPMAPSDLGALFERPAFQEMPYEKRREALGAALSAVYDYTASQPDFDDSVSGKFGQVAEAAYERLDEEHTLGEKVGEAVSTVKEFAVGMLKDAAVAGAALSSAASRINPFYEDRTQGASQTFGQGFGLGSARYVDALNHLLDKTTTDSYGDLKSSLDDIKQEIDEGTAPVSSGFEEWLNKRSTETLAPQHKWTQFRLGDYGITDEGKAFDVAHANQLSTPHNAGLIATYVRTRDPQVWEQLEKNIATTPLAGALGEEAEKITKSESGKWLDRVFGEGTSQHLTSASDPLMVAGFLIPGARAAGAVGLKKAAIQAAASVPEQAALGGVMALGQDPEASTGEVVKSAAEMAALGTVVHAGVAGAKAVAGKALARGGDPKIDQEAIDLVADPGTRETVEAVVKGVEETPSVVDDLVSREETTTPTPASVSAGTSLAGSEARTPGVGVDVSPAPEQPLVTARVAPTETTPPTIASGGRGDQGPSSSGGARDLAPPISAEEQIKSISENATSNKREVVEIERKLRGVDPIPEEEVIANTQTIARGQEMVEENPNLPNEIVDRLLDTIPEERTISLDDSAALIVHRVKLQKERDALIAQGTNEARKRQDEVEKQIDNLDQAAKYAGSAWGRFGQFWQRLVREDYSLEGMRRRARLQNGGELYEGQAERIEGQAAKVAESDAIIAEREKLLSAIEQGKHHVEQLKTLIAETEGPVTRTPRQVKVKPLSEKISAILDEQAAAAMERIKARRGKVFATIDPGLAGLADEIIIGAAKLGKGVVKFADWSAQMIADVGDYIKPQLKTLWNASRAKLRALEQDRDPAAERATTLERLKVRVEEGDAPEDLHRYARKIAKSHIEEGITELDPLTDAVYADLKQVMPDITKTESRDAWSGYGRWKPLDPDPVKTTLRQRSTEAQKVSTIERYQKKLPGLKTGAERQAPTDKARALDREGRALAKKMGIQIVDPERQLKGAIDAVKSRLRNEIADMDFALSEKKPIVRDRSGVKITDPAVKAEVDALRAARDAKKAEYDLAFPKKPITPEEQLRRTTAAAERNLKAANERLAEAKKGNFGKPKKTSLTSKRLEEIRDQVKTAAEEVKLLRDLDAAIQEKRTVDRLNRTREALEKRLKGGEEKLAAREGPDSKAVADLKAKNAKLRENLSEQNRQKDLRASIKALEKRLEEGDYEARKPKVREDSTASEQLRAERDALQELLVEMRKESIPKKSEVEIALQTAKVRALNRTAELNRRRAAKDFKPKERKEIVAVTPEEKRLEAELVAATAEKEKAIQEYNRDRHADFLANRTTGRKIYDGIQQTRGALLNVASSLDFSAPRQALTTILANTGRIITNPVRAPKMLGKPLGRMFKAWANEDVARKMDIERRGRPNAKNGAYKTMGIEFSELDAMSFTKYEENAHSILDQWASMPYKTGDTVKDILTAAPKFGSKAIRMSNRAFITFLNETRADLADELLRANFKDRPPTVVELKALGNHVNIATGRGKLNPKLAAGASEILWAPKLLASRVQFLTGQPLWSGTMRTRKIILKEYARVIMGGFLLAAVSRLFSDRNEYDPRSSDFMKIVRGNTRIDPWGGLQQVSVLASRLKTGETKQKGKIKDIGEGRSFGVKGPYGLITDFVRSKLRPDIGLVIDLLDERNMVGEKTRTPEYIAKNTIVPLPFRDIVDIIKEHGWAEGLAIEAAGQFGAGVSNYENDKGRSSK